MHTHHEDKHRSTGNRRPPSESQSIDDSIVGKVGLILLRLSLIRRECCYVTIGEPQ